MRTKQELLELLKESYSKYYNNLDPTHVPKGLCHITDELKNNNIIDQYEYLLLSGILDQGIFKKRREGTAYSFFSDSYSYNGWWFFHPRNATARIDWINNEINEINKNL